LQHSCIRSKHISLFFHRVNKSHDAFISRLLFRLLAKMQNSLACSAACFPDRAIRCIASSRGLNIRVARQRIYFAIQQEFHCSSCLRMAIVQLFLLGLTSLIIRPCPISFLFTRGTVNMFHVRPLYVMQAARLCRLSMERRL
jgi:hypothetical protein